MKYATSSLSAICLSLFSAGMVSAQSTTAAAVPAPMTTPAMAGPLAANPSPSGVDTGALGTWYVTGAVTGLSLSQDNHVPGDHAARTNLGNGQVFIQKTSGQLQFFVQAGTYAIPSLGTAYLSADKTTRALYGNVPQAFIKYAPNDSFSILAGKLPTLVGSEYTFTFENMNIERGLLWNQENAVNRGVQATYVQGPISASVSVNDGYYSDHYSWVWGSLAYAIDKNNSLSVIAGGNAEQTNRSNFATPLLQDNSQIANLNYTHLDGAWTIAPSLQYMRVPSHSDLGITHSASTAGVALLASYAFNTNFSVAGRAEYINSNGNTANGSPSLLYGAGSNAWSLTLTPTYQNRLLFVRAEVSYVKAGSVTPGFALGRNLDSTAQSRVLIETGLLF